MDSFKTIEQHESEVRSYCRSFTTTFDVAQGSYMYDEDGNAYLDFFAGAGALNYGHNNPKLKEKLIEYIQRDGITHGLDMATRAKAQFLETFQRVVLGPRGMNYKVQFPGPTGTNTVEAAMKLARKVTGRSKIVSFTNAFHGMTLGSLSITGNAFKRSGAGVDLHHGMSMPFENYFEDGSDTIDYIERMMADQGSGYDAPAAAIVETIQAEGGVNVASFEWLQRLQALCKRHGMLFIIDDIQVGCGRTGPFFSFEGHDLDPDIICLSKSLSGYGHPFAITLMKPEHDQWEPGEHNGTFRGNNLAFVTGAAALEEFWSDDKLTKAVEEKAGMITNFLNDMAAKYPQIEPKVKGRGFIQGIESGIEDVAGDVCAEAFDRNLIMETAGPSSSVFKLLPALTIAKEDLQKGFGIIEESIQAVIKKRNLAQPASA